MSRLPVIAIFDIGKTNKKRLLFNQQYQVVSEESIQFEETVDEDGFPCDDIAGVTDWVIKTFDELLADKTVEVKAVNFSGYGASFVFLDQHDKLLPPLYNYLKPLNAGLQSDFYNKYGGESSFSLQTASPVLGNLNSGMQLYRIRKEKPKLFDKISTALHLPQYLAFILSGGKYSDLTSVGCHTNLWNFRTQSYHQWVTEEGIVSKLAPIIESDGVSGFTKTGLPVGVGLHDSSSALIPYLRYFTTSFVLISTGTWSISLNPFNDAPLTDAELKQDCLCFLSYNGKPVKASRLFAGHEHDDQVEKISVHFAKDLDYFKSVKFDSNFVKQIADETGSTSATVVPVTESAFQARDLRDFSTYEEAYHQLIADIVADQYKSTNLVIGDTEVDTIYVDGGFSRNEIYMNMLASVYPGKKLYAATVPQASALGAAMAMHEYWNDQPFPGDLIQLRLYEAQSR